jgi:predicted metal-binding membrane protein
VTETALRRSGPGELRLGVVLVAAAAGAWALTAGRMDGMDAGPGADLGGLGWFAVSWVVMMAAMMLPALAPMLVAYERRASRAGRADSVATFAAGYYAAWLAAGLLAYAVIKGVRLLGPGFLAWDAAGRYVAAAVIAGAGLYQLTARKGACLRACRERAAFIAERWRPGRIGALRMGLEHGGWCVGCSWALMAALFALGAMSLTWMALVTVLVAGERTLPRPARLGVAAVLVALGLWVALAPGAVPGLTVPDSSSGPMGGAMRMR